MLPLPSALSARLMAPCLGVAPIVSAVGSPCGAVSDRLGHLSSHHIPRHSGGILSPFAFHSRVLMGCLQVRTSMWY
jgi:hypothetical protein